MRQPRANDGRDQGRPLTRRYLGYGVVLVLMILGAGVLSTTLHELLGHGLACVSAGGSIDGVRIAPGGGGYCGCAHPREELWPLIHAAGIAVDLALGTIAFGLSRRVRNRYGALFLLIYAGTACLIALSYLAFGLFYGAGDPGNVVDRLELGSIAAMYRGERSVWIPFAVALPLVAFILARHYREKQARFLGELPLSTTLAVLFAVLATLGGALAILPQERIVEEQAELSRSSGEFSRQVLAVARATREELRGESEERIGEVLQERIARIERPKRQKEPHAFGSFLNALAGLGALAGVIWSRGRTPTRGEGAASPPPPLLPLPDS